MWKKIINGLFRRHLTLNRYLLFISALLVIIYLFPAKKHFKYEFGKGKVWAYENYYAPFDFGIRKSADELENERKKITDNKDLYYKFSDSVNKSCLEKSRRMRDEIIRSLPSDTGIQLLNSHWKAMNTYYSGGYLENPIDGTHKIFYFKDGEIHRLRQNNTASQRGILPLIDRIVSFLSNRTDTTGLRDSLIHIWKPNLKFDKAFTEEMMQDKLSKIVPTTGFVKKGSLIVSRGDIVDADKFKKLSSIKKEYENRTDLKNSGWLIAAYSALIGLVLLMLYFFLQQYRNAIFHNLSKLSFILFNVVIAITLTVLILKFKPDYLYGIPYAILPLVLKAFFDSRLGLFTHVLTILLLGFIVPNGFEFIFIQIIAGIVTILTVSEISKRANLFISVMKITMVYLFSYVAFSILTEGDPHHIKWWNLGLFIINGLISVSLVNPLIFTFEKIFGLVSDESLRELTDTNNKLLRKLNEKAPGTFQHSIQVATLAEAAAEAIGANRLLIRVGALYHDIGKLLNPIYFTENQSSGMNPHDELSPRESAQIIIDHVINGVELAQKHKLPDRVVDFIRTHHGSGVVYYFYKKAVNENPHEDVNPDEFRYPGPIPYSKETAILMMCDASEAASKSLPEPTAAAISDLIDQIIQNQMDEGQYKNANITFKEIDTVKKVIKKKLNSIYHVRIAYPE